MEQILFTTQLDIFFSHKHQVLKTKNL